jgi:hypothetical protein
VVDTFWRDLASVGAERRTLRQAVELLARGHIQRVPSDAGLVLWWLRHREIMGTGSASSRRR